MISWCFISDIRFAATSTIVHTIVQEFLKLFNSKFGSFLAYLSRFQFISYKNLARQFVRTMHCIARSCQTSCRMFSGIICFFQPWESVNFEKPFSDPWDDFLVADETVSSFRPNSSSSSSLSSDEGGLIDTRLY